MSVGGARGGAGGGIGDCRGLGAGPGLRSVRNGEVAIVAGEVEALETEVGHEVSEVAGPGSYRALTVIARLRASTLGKCPPHREASWDPRSEDGAVSLFYL